MIDSISTLVRTFFERMWIQITSIQVTPEDAQNVYNIRIETPDSPLVIGMHGQNLQAINHLLSRMIEKITGGFSIIHLEVNDYMKEKDDRFFRYLDGRIDFAMKSRNDVSVPNLNAYERKKAHSYIADKKIEWLRTYSHGEGKERMLHLIYEGPVVATNATSTSTPRKTEIDISEDGIGI